MKKLVLVLVAMFTLNVAAVAQDIIVLRDGSIVRSKIMEVGENDVKYKKWDNINGPIYTMSILNISAIDYQNGTKYNFADYVKNKSNIAENINNTESTVSQSITTSGNNTPNGMDNYVYLQQQQLWHSGSTMKVIGVLGLIGGFASGTIFIVNGSLAEGLGCYAAGSVLCGLFSILGNNRMVAAENIMVTNFYKYNLNEDIAISTCIMDNITNNQKCLGAGISIHF